MAHILINGMTQSGKTTLAKQLVEQYQRSGINVLVLDPINDPSWGADFQTSDPDEFLDKVWTSRQCACFIDEAGETAGQYDKEMVKTATKGRHWGHRFHYISQRGSMLSTTIRGQCSQLFLFTSGLKDSKIYAEEFGHEELKQANTLKQGEFFHCDKFDKLEKKRIF